MPTPRFFFHDSPEPSAAIGARLLEAASHVRIDLWKTSEDDLHVQFEVSGCLNGDGEIGVTPDADDTRRAVGTVRELVRMFAAKAEGGGE
jgi:hypothetical protein